MTNKSLGRGLSAFLEVQNAEILENDIVKVDVDTVIQNPFQPRQTFDEENLHSLAESIKKQGILQPILVCRLEDGNYQLIAGERRLRASKIAGLREIPAILTDIDREDQLEIAIVENIQRENLNPLEEAEAYRRLMDEFGRTQEELSEALGKSRSHIANMLRLLSLPDQVKNLIRAGQLTFGHGRALVNSEDAVAIAHRTVKQSLSVRQVENLVRQRRNNYPNDNYVDSEISNLGEQISSMVGLRSTVKLKGNGGVVEINFQNFEELDSLIQKLNK